jgi:hypothetical protein
VVKSFVPLVVCAILYKHPDSTRLGQCMVCCLQDLAFCVWDVCISSELNTVIDCFEVDIDWLCGIDWFIHRVFVVLDVDGRDFAITIQEVIQ